MIAYLSGDEKLIRVLNEDGDVFKMITAQWKNIPVDEVTSDQRAQAKQARYVSLRSLEIACSFFKKKNILIFFLFLH